MPTEIETGSAKTTTDQEAIRRWVESRNGRPSCVRGTGGGPDVGMLRIDFPGFSGEETLQEISWDEFFRAFEQNNLAFLYQDRTSDGGESRFFKFVSRDRTAEGDGSSGVGGSTSRSSRRSTTGRSGGRKASGGAGGPRAGGKSPAKPAGRGGSAARKSADGRKPGKARGVSRSGARGAKKAQKRAAGRKVGKTGAAKRSGRR
jgi:hypothetical protein